MGYPENWLNDSKTPECIPEDYLVRELTIGNKYHISTAPNRGMVWVLKSVTPLGCALLESPKNKRPKSTNVSTLRETNRNASINRNLRIKKEKRRMELEAKENQEKSSEEMKFGTNLPIPKEKVKSDDTMHGKKWIQSDIDYLETKILEGGTPYEVALRSMSMFPKRTMDSVRSKIYEIISLKKNGEKIYVKKENKTLETADSIPKAYNEEAFLNSREENIIDEEKFPTKIVLKKKPEEEKADKLHFYDEDLIVTNGIIKIPFMGEVECSFVINGTFTIERIIK